MDIDLDDLRELRSQPTARRKEILKRISAVSRISCYIGLKRWGRDDGISQALYDNHFYGQWTPYTFQVWEIVNCISWHMLADDDHSVRIAAAVSDAVQSTRHSLPGFLLWHERDFERTDVRLMDSLHHARAWSLQCSPAIFDLSTANFFLLLQNPSLHLILLDSMTSDIAKDVRHPQECLTFADLALIRE